MARKSAQRGYTLVELIIASGLAAFVLTALTSVIFVSTQANKTWSPRLQATGELRHFQQSFYEDMALGSVPSISVSTNPCLVPVPAATPPITIDGQLYKGSPPVAQSYQAVYCYSPTSRTVQRYIGGVPTVVARNVTKFAWRIDLADGSPVVVIDITTTDNSVPSQYSTTQQLRYYPRRNAP
jgi:type II secretory pathway pseudopilin PulG